MTKQQVRDILPPDDSIGSGGGVGFGSGYAIIYAVSERWFVELPFIYTGAGRVTDQDRLADGTARLLRSDGYSIVVRLR